MTITVTEYHSTIRTTPPALPAPVEMRLLPLPPDYRAPTLGEVALLVLGIIGIVATAIVVDVARDILDA